MTSSVQFGRRGLSTPPSSPAPAYRQTSRFGSTEAPSRTARGDAPKSSLLGLGYYLDPITANYFNFSGKTPRKAFWMYMLFSFVFTFGLAVVSLMTRSFWPIQLFSLGILLPDLGIKVRRLHDVGKSGWWFLVAFVPFGAFYLLYLWAQPSESPAENLGEVFA
jgi:hypothetical protein